MTFVRHMTFVIYLSFTWYIPGIYHAISFRFIPGIYLVYAFQTKLCAPPGSRIAIEMQQHTGIGLQECLMFCRMWQCHCQWAFVSQGQAVARLGPRRQSRAADVGGTAATDAHCSGGGAA